MVTQNVFFQIKCLELELIVVVAFTFWHNVFWRTFHEHSDTVTLPVNSANNNHHLVFGCEWKVHDFSGVEIPSDEHVMGWDLVINEELDHGNFKCLSEWLILQGLIIGFKANVSVGNNDLRNELFHLSGNLKLGREIVISVVLNAHVTELVGCNSHLSFGNGTGLSNADVMEHGAGLHSCKIFD